MSGSDTFVSGTVGCRVALYLAEGMVSDHGVSLGGVGASRGRAGGEGRLLLQPLFNLLILKAHIFRNPHGVVFTLIKLCLNYWF